VDPSGHFALAESLAVSYLSMQLQPMLDQLWQGLNNYTHGLGGGSALKAVNGAEGLFIQGLSQHAGINVGRTEFFTALQGAPFLLAHNPFVFALRNDCYRYAVLGFIPNAPIYGCANLNPVFPNQNQVELSGLGYDWAGDLAKSFQERVDITKAATLESQGIFAATVINSSVDFVNIFAQLPNQIGHLGEATGRTGYVGDEPLFQPFTHLGEGAGRFSVDMSRENGAGLAQDVSVVFGTVAAGMPRTAVPPRTRVRTPAIAQAEAVAAANAVRQAVDVSQAANTVARVNAAGEAAAGEAAGAPKQLTPGQPCPGVAKSSLPEWLKKRFQAGEDFNKANRARYPYNEVEVVDAEGNKFRVDSYDPVKGEIVSRKFTQLSDVQENTVIKYLNEMGRKYPSGAEITDSPFNSEVLRGGFFEGDLVLEVPVQIKPIPQAVLDAARKKGITIRDVTGRIYK